MEGEELKVKHHSVRAACHLPSYVTSAGWIMSRSKSPEMLRLVCTDSFYHSVLCCAKTIYFLNRDEYFLGVVMDVVGSFQVCKMHPI